MCRLNYHKCQQHHIREKGLSSLSRKLKKVSSLIDNFSRLKDTTEGSKVRLFGTAVSVKCDREPTQRDGCVYTRVGDGDEKGDETSPRSDGNSLMRAAVCTKQVIKRLR